MTLHVSQIDTVMQEAKDALDLVNEVRRLRAALEDAATTLIQVGQVDGAHHKQWGIDQALRLLFGEVRYKNWITQPNLENID
jgi:hypothetical protein